MRKTNEAFGAMCVVAVLTCGLAPAAVAQVMEASLHHPLCGPSGCVPQGGVLVGETFKFKVVLTNVGGFVGHRPFLDLYLEAAGKDCDSLGGPCDGLTFESARAVFTNQGLDLTPLDPHPAMIPGNPSCTNQLTPCGMERLSNHRLASNLLLTGPLGLPLPPSLGGYQSVTLPLPFASYFPTQPPIVVEVEARVHKFADLMAPLQICAVGGFALGTGFLPASPTVSLDDADCATVTPLAFKVAKRWVGPENQECAETATGPNHPKSYVVQLDVANGCTLDGLVVEDCLDPDVVLGTINATPEPSSVGTTPAGCVQADYSETIVTGTAAADDVVVDFDFHVPELIAPGLPVLGPGCAQRFEDMARAEARLANGDPRDPVNTIVDVDTHDFSARCLAVQKSVTIDRDTGAPGPSPGDILRYAIDFQVSDFKTLGEMEVRDFLSDGQTFLKALPYLPTLSVTDKFGTVAYTLTEFLDFVAFPGQGAATCKGGATISGATEAIFFVSSGMQFAPVPMHARHAKGILTGGRSGLPAGGAATGRIEFFAQIDEEFQYQPSVDVSVDKLDPLLNCVEMTAWAFRPADAPAIPVCCEASDVEDDSAAGAEIVFDFVEKSISHIDGAELRAGGPPPHIAPGDEVTFGIDYTLPTSDVERLSFRDFLPHPIFDLADPDADPATPQPWPAGPLCPPGPVPPAVGAASGGGAALCAFLATVPLMPFSIASLPDNSLLFDYGPQFDDPQSQSRDVDLSFTITTTAAPYPDCITIVNQAYECEDNTFGVTFCQNVVAPFVLTQPCLNIRKGVVQYTGRPGAQYSPSPPIPPGVTVTASGTSGYRFNKSLTSALIDGYFVSDLDGVDAEDVVTFAIIVENRGKSIRGAFDVTFRDLFPKDLDGPTNLSVTDGSGRLLTCNGGILCQDLPGKLFGAGITLDDDDTSDPPIDCISGSGALGAKDDPDGRNLIVVTFDARIKKDALVGACFVNSTEVTRYAGVDCGPDHVSAGLCGPFRDGARVCLARPVATKSIVATSEPHTGAPGGVEELAIGELVSYRLEVVLPEGTAPKARIIDKLPPWLQYVAGSGTLQFFGGITSSIPQLNNANAMAIPLDPVLSGAPASQTITVDLGNLSTQLNTPAEERIVYKFVARVANGLNNRCDPEDNGFSFRFSRPLKGPSQAFNFGPVGSNPTFGGGKTLVTVQSNSVPARIVEPSLECQKEFLGFDGDAQRWRIRCVNAGECNTDAFDVRITDVIPAPGVILSVTPDPGCTVAPGNAVLDVTCSGIVANGTLQVEFTTVNVPCGTPNRADISYTSLPGPEGTFPDPTGFGPAGPSGTETGERNCDTDADNQNDYCASAQATIPCSPAGCVDPPDGMVAWWALDERSGSRSFDRAGHPSGPHHGDFHPDFPAPLHTPDGKVDWALEFAGNFGFVEVPERPTPNDTALDFMSGNLSIDAWVLPRDAENPHILSKLRSFSFPLDGYVLLVDSGNGGMLRLDIGDGTNNFTCRGGSGLFNEWHHVAVTVTDIAAPSAAVKIYVDGVERVTCPFWGLVVPIDNDSPLALGLGFVPDVAGNSYRGLIDEVEIFRRVLAPDEILGIYQADSAGKCKTPLPQTESEPEGDEPPALHERRQLSPRPPRAAPPRTTAAPQEDSPRPDPGAPAPRRRPRAPGA